MARSKPLRRKVEIFYAQARGIDPGLAQTILAQDKELYKFWREFYLKEGVKYESKD